MMSLDSADPESAMIESVTTKSFKAGVEEKNSLSQARPVCNLRPLFSRRVDLSKGRNRARNARFVMCDQDTRVTETADCLQLLHIYESNKRQKSQGGGGA